MATRGKRKDTPESARTRKREGIRTSVRKPKTSARKPKAVATSRKGTAAALRSKLARSLKAAETARMNGKKGGRPRRHRYAELLNELEDPATIENPLDLLPWMFKLQVLTMLEMLAGRGSRRLDQQIRSTIRTLKWIEPLERIRQAEAAVLATAGSGTPARKRTARTIRAPKKSRPIR